MVTVRVSETYDLNTYKDRMGIVAIHTPREALIKRLYSGLMTNHRFIRYVKCDVHGACASVLPADPLQVGVEAGTVAPEDMFNPILYKAVTNEAFDSIANRVSSAYGSGGTSQNAPDSVDIEQVGVNAETAFANYYALLSENDRWAKSMPQQGFSITDLVPLAHTVLNSFGNMLKPGNVPVTVGQQNTASVPGTLGDVPHIQGGTDPYTDTMRLVGGAMTFRGHAVPCPRMPLHYSTDDSSFYYPKTMVAILILPPARRNIFYYRMRVTWTVEFTDVIPATEFTSQSANANIGGRAYFKAWTDPTTDLDSQNDTVDVSDMEIKKIMES